MKVNTKALAKICLDGLLARTGTKKTVLMMFLFLLYLYKVSPTLQCCNSFIKSMSTGRDSLPFCALQRLNVCSVILNDAWSDDGLPRTPTVSNNCKLVMVLLHDAVSSKYSNKISLIDYKNIRIRLGMWRHYCTLSVISTAQSPILIFTQRKEMYIYVTRRSFDRVHCQCR